MREPSIEKVFACRLEAELPPLPTTCSRADERWRSALHLEQLDACLEQWLSPLRVARMDGGHVGGLQRVRQHGHLYAAFGPSSEELHAFLSRHEVGRHEFHVAGRLLHHALQP